MLPKFWEKAGEKLAERWILTVGGPAFVFWVGGGIAYVLDSNSSLTDLSQLWLTLTAVEQVLIIVSVFILVVFSATIIERGQAYLLKLVEGYWPKWFAGLRFGMAERKYAKIQDKVKELDALSSAITIRDVARRSQLDNEIAHLPVKKSHCMPTSLGNILSAAERYPEIRYGLDAMVCWPRLYPLLSDTLRDDIAFARDHLNQSTRLMAWGILFLVWIIWQWWALLGLVVAWLGYRGMIIAAGVYGDLIRAAFDIHRFDLYKSLNWPLPNEPENERMMGKKLTEYLFRGNAPPDFIFANGKENGNERE